MKKFLSWLGALALWLLSILGALALAVWLRLSPEHTRALVILIAFIAFFGAFLPLVQKK